MTPREAMVRDVIHKCPYKTKVDTATMTLAEIVALARKGELGAKVLERIVIRMDELLGSYADKEDARRVAQRIINSEVEATQ